MSSPAKRDHNQKTPFGEFFDGNKLQESFTNRGNFDENVI
jgi:hypothetical protein